jgi:hypothetical protein
MRDRPLPRYLSHIMTGLLLTANLTPAQSFQQPPLTLAESRPTAGAAFGIALAIGDFNNDKIADLAVSNSAERVFIFYGRTTPRTTPDRTLSSRETGIAFGMALAAGDWNGDGRTDLAIGAPEASNSEDSFFDGRVIIYPGSSNFGTSPVTLRSPIPPDPDFLTGGLFGYALASGDVDGNKVSDVIVSAWYLDATVILYGGRTIGSRRTILKGNTIGEQFGFAVAAGDVNKDGFADVAIGAPFGGPTGTGAVYLFFGGKTLSGRPDLILPNPHPPSDPEDSTFASALAIADLNGDGYADIIVGAPNTSPKELAPGRVYIFFGGTTLRNTPDLVLENSTPAFGYSLATGDLNGDGTSDLVVSAIGATVNTRPRAGQVHIFLGGSAIGPTAHMILDPPSPEAEGEFGSAMAIGDLNRDGKADLAISAPGVARRAGRVFLYLGR